MIDLPAIMRRHERHSAEDWLMRLNIAAAPYMDSEQLDEFLSGLRMALDQETEEDDDQFDAEGFAALRARLMGGL